MNKLIKILLIGIFFALGTFIQAQDLSSRLDELSDESTFGYNESIQISIGQITTQKVIISSPMIIDELGGKITTYTVMYSENTVEEMTDDPTLLDLAKEKTFEFTGTETTLEMEINLYDGLDQNTVYYVNVIPKDAYGIPGQISVQDLRFRLSDLSSGEGLFVGAPVEQHAAAGADMSLANITHSCNPACNVVTTSAKNITLRWFAVDGSESIDIFLQSSSSSSFTRIATVNMSDEQYALSTNNNGEHIFKFTPNNDGTEIHYIVNISGIGTEPTTPSTGIAKVPTTGPMQNVLIILAITLLVYRGYRKLYRKH